MKKAILCAFSLLPFLPGGAAWSDASLIPPGTPKWDLSVTAEHRSVGAQYYLEVNHRTGSDPITKLENLKSVLTGHLVDTSYLSLTSKEGTKVTLLHPSNGQVAKMRPQAFKVRTNYGEEAPSILKISVNTVLDDQMAISKEEDGSISYAFMMCSEKGKGLELSDASRLDYACIFQKGLFVGVDSMGGKPPLDLTSEAVGEEDDVVNVVTSSIAYSSDAAYVFAPTMLGGGRSYQTIEAARTAFKNLRESKFSGGLAGGSDFPATIESGNQLEFATLVSIVFRATQ